jgi:methyl-accepting chemotaxis protein
VTSQVQTISASANEQQSVSQEMAGKLNEITLAVQEENARIDEIALHSRKLNDAIREQFDVLASFRQDEVTLHTVKADHLNWKIRLTNMAMGTDHIPDHDMKDHHQCRLGRWYDNYGKLRYADDSDFQKMEAPHARFHEIGKEIAKLASSGQQQAATQKIKELDTYSNQLYPLIDNLLLKIKPS